MNYAINFRAIFYCFVSFGVGILCANYLFNLNIFIWLLTSLSFLAIFIYCFKFKKFIILICLVLSFIFGIGAFFIDSNNFNKNIYNGENVNVVGRVSEDYVFQNGQSFFTLTNVLVNGKNESNIAITANGESNNLKVGMYIEFYADLYNYQLFENDKFNYFAYKDKTPYFAEIQTSEVVFLGGEMSLTEKFKFNIREILNNSMSPNGASFAYSVLFGDKTFLFEDLKNDFNNAGVAHVLAVSGLHIGILVGLLFLIFKKLKFSKLLQFLLIFLILLIYSYICDFSASVVRASLMCVIFLATGVFGKRYDMLNSIGLAGLMILVVSPLMVFDIGFQLSFICVIAIAFFLKPLSNFFIKHKICKSEVVASALAIEIATTVATFPLIITYFSQISLLCSFANLLAIPIFTIGYTLLFILLPFVLIFQLFNLEVGFILFLPDLLLRIVIIVVDFFGNIDFATINTIYLSVPIIIAFYIILFLLSRYVVLGKAKRLTVISLVIMICFIFSAGFSSPLTPKSNNITFVNSQNLACVLTTENKDICVISQSSSLNDINDYLINKRFYYIDLLILTNNNFNYNQQQNIKSFVAKFNVNNVVLFEEIYSVDLNIFKKSNLIYVSQMKNDIVDISNNQINIFFQTFNSLNFQYMFLGSNCKGLFINFNNQNIFIGLNKIGSVQQETLKEYLNNITFDCVYAKRESLGFFQISCSFNYITNYKFTDFQDFPNTTNILQNYHSLYLQGNFTF